MSPIEEKICTIEFWIERNEHFTVSIMAFRYTNDQDWLDKYYRTGATGWNYCVYAYVFETHPLFNNDEALINLPFHCGCTYDKIIDEQPFEMIYDFQKKVRKKVVGADYSHLGDPVNDHQSPLERIPHYIEKDAKELVDALKRETK